MRRRIDQGAKPQAAKPMRLWVLYPTGATAMIAEEPAPAPALTERFERMRRTRNNSRLRIVGVWIEDHTSADGEKPIVCPFACSRQHTSTSSPARK